MTPLRQRMIEDMNIRGLGEKTQKAHIRNVKHFAAFLGRSPDTATPEELRSYQLGVCQTSCPPISRSVSDFRDADFGFWIEPDGASRLPVSGFA